MTGTKPIFFAPLRVPVSDQRTGLMSREWYLFLQALWMRTGGSIAPPSTDDLLESIEQGLGAADVQAFLQTEINATRQLPSGLFDLELRKDLEGLSQGPTL
jgi:hypothetical protein